MTGDVFFARDAAAAIACTVEEWGLRAWSSELTEARAAAIVNAARDEVREGLRKAEEARRKRQSKAGRRR